VIIADTDKFILFEYENRIICRRESYNVANLTKKKEKFSRLGYNISSENQKYNSTDHALFRDKNKFGGFETLKVLPIKFW
jgi:hypothetical protein